MRTLIATALLLASLPAISIAAVPTPAQMRSRIESIRTGLPQRKAQLDALRAGGQDVAYPLVTYTVLDNFTGYALDDLNTSGVSWRTNRVGRELPDMEAMAQRLGEQLAGATAGRITLPKVPRWSGDARPKIDGPSFVAADGRPCFFVGYGHFKQVRDDIEKFPAYGINIVQHGEFGPSGVFLKEDQADDTALNNLINELDRAAKAGVAVDFLISPHYLPQWFFDKYPKLRVPRADFFPWSIYAPQGRELVKKFVDYVIPRIKDKPALLSICLSNEPINCQNPDEYSIAAWHAWLKQRHGDVATLNGRWKTKYATFDEIPQPNALNRSTEPRPGAAWCDFVRWNQQYFAEFHKALADMVHQAAPNLPVHVKATTWHAYRSKNIMSGDDPTLLGAVTDLNGNDSVNLWGFNQRAGDLIERGTRDFAQGWRENALAYELQRSVRDAPVFNSENHLIFDGDSRYIDPAHVRSALWMGAIHGQSATTLWVWEREMSNPASAFGGDIMERASCAEAVGIVCHDLNRVAPQITAIQKGKPDVLILHSNTSAVWDGHPYDDAMMKLFTALSFTGLKIGFVTEWQLEQHQAGEARILFVPGSVHLSDAAFKGIGLMRGQIIFAGDDKLLSRNEYDQPRGERVVATTLATGKTWQETLKAIGPVLQNARVQPAIKVQSDGGDWGVQWQTATTPEGLVVNLYNARHDPIDVTIGDRASVDLLTGQTIAASQKLRLQPMEVRLVRLKDGK